MKRRWRLIQPFSAPTEKGKARDRLAALWPIFALASVLFFAGALVALPSIRVEGPWKGWRLLFVPTEIGEESVLERLKSAGIERIVSESSQTLRLSAWDGQLEDLPLGLVDQRLLPDDPRLDSYVRGLKAWFHAFGPARQYQIFYIKNRPRAWQRDGLALAAASISPDCLLLGGEKPRATFLGMLGPGAALFTGLILVLARRRGSLLRIAAILPWLIVAAAGEGSLLALVWAGLFTLLGMAMESAIAEYWRSGRIRNFGPLLLRGTASSFFLLLPALGSLIASPGLVPAFLLAFLADLALVAGFILFRRRRTLEMAKPPFIALPIAENASPQRSGAQRILTGAACCAAAMGLALSIGGRFEANRDSAIAEISAPLPERPSSKDLPLPRDSLDKVALRPERDPPDLADWLVHRARQEALFLDPLGTKDPDPFAPIGLPMPGGGVKPVLEFSESWARAAYRSLPELSIEGMLRDQGGFRRASIRAIGSSSSQPLASFDAILYILFLAFPLYGALSGLPRGERAGSVRNSYESL